MKLTPEQIKGRIKNLAKLIMVMPEYYWEYIWWRDSWKELRIPNIGIISL